MIESVVPIGATVREGDAEFGVTWLLVGDNWMVLDYASRGVDTSTSPRSPMTPAGRTEAEAVAVAASTGSCTPIRPFEEPSTREQPSSGSRSPNRVKMLAPSPR